MYDAVYARQSLLKEKSISIETQVKMAEAVCKNPIRYYRDPGFSGGNMNRPEFMKMMKDVEDGIIAKIVVYKIDRISRSLLDFATTWEILEKHGVEFVSVTENFDTSNAVGKAMLYIAAVFAELERKQTISRVTDNYYERAKFGYWLGGPSPYGFNLVTDKKSEKGILEANEDMQIVKRIFDTYNAPLVSLSDIAKELNNENIPGPRKYWSAVSISRLLLNPCYVKADVSIYSFYKEMGVDIHGNMEQFMGMSACQLIGKTKHRKSATRVNGTAYNKKTVSNMKLIISNWGGVIDSEIFLRCQEKLKKNKQIGKTGSGSHTWLSGLLKCGECQYSLAVVRSQCTKDRYECYLRCSGRTIRAVCTAKSFPKAWEVEEEVQRELEKVLNQCTTAAEKPTEDPELQIVLYKIEQQIQNLMDVLKSSVPSEQMIQMVNKELENLGSQRKEMLVEQQKERMPIKLEKIDFSKLSFDDKKKVVNTYIRKIDVFTNPERICIEWKV